MSTQDAESTFLKKNTVINKGIHFHWHTHEIKHFILLLAVHNCFQSLPKKTTNWKNVFLKLFLNSQSTNNSKKNILHTHKKKEKNEINKTLTFH